MSGQFTPSKIVSGGQSGVDRAALDWAIAAEIPHGGWCPLGRTAEDGRIPDVYQLVELDSPNYADRTRKNIEDSDATLILYGRRLEGGTLLTARHADRLGKPCMKVRLFGPRPNKKVRLWLDTHQPRVLNIAGPRASNHPRIYELAFDYLSDIFGSGTHRLF